MGDDIALLVQQRWIVGALMPPRRRRHAVLAARARLALRACGTGRASAARRANVALPTARARLALLANAAAFALRARCARLAALALRAAQRSRQRGHVLAQADLQLGEAGANHIAVLVNALALARQIVAQLAVGALTRAALLGQDIG